MFFAAVFVFLSAVLSEASADSSNCELPDAIENGNIRIFHFKGRNFFLVQCHSDYILEGERSGSCKEGKWSVPFPRCVKTQGNVCRHLKPPVYGKKSCSSTIARINSSCSFDCSKNYALKGSRQRVCQENLEWSGEDTYCEPIVDTDECANKENPCQHFCVNTPGGFKCLCSSGYMLVDGTKCEDIDECFNKENNPCQHSCDNTLGSFKCSCLPGYILVHGTKCEGCRKDSYWSDVDKKCLECPKNSYTETDGKNSIIDCKCHPGFEGDPSRNIPCQDIDECSMDNFGCSDKCINTPGSVYCSCPLGFELELNNKTCTDINECEINNGGCQDKCLNSVGSYSCNCGSGYTVSKTNQYLCDDIDECAIDNGGCSDTCINFDGGYFCTCKSGFRLDSTEKHCKAITCPDVPTPHFSKKKCKTGGNRIKNGINYPINSTCSFDCLKGFKENVKGKIKCEEDGQWSGTVSKCIALSCPALKAPEHGDVRPKSCVKGTSSVKEKCTYTCNPGYRLKSKAPVVRCLNNLTWSNSNESQAATCVRIKKNPFISCPPDISVDLLPLENSSTIVVPEPDTDWNDYDVTPNWVSVGKPTIFPAGKTDVVFSVKNQNKKFISECILTVNVVDNEPPVFYQCPNSFEVENANAYGVPVAWEEPVIFDNVGIESIESNMKANSTLTPGVHIIEYLAKDEAGNIATCSFQINVTATYCSDLEDPLHGQANCVDWMYGKICEPTCNEGFMRNPEELYYMCNNTGVWYPSDTISECLKFHGTNDFTCEAGYHLLSNTEGPICMECPKKYASSTTYKMCE